VLVHRFLHLFGLIATQGGDLVYHRLGKVSGGTNAQEPKHPEYPAAQGLDQARPVCNASRPIPSRAQYAAVYTRVWAANSVNTRVRLKAENDQLTQEVALLREEIRIKDARMARIDPHRRPHYPPTQRMAVLELKAARGWSLEQTRRVFLLTAATIASWMKRVDAEGPDAFSATVEFHAGSRRRPIVSMKRAASQVQH
jgi:hypothetical protein